MSSNIGAGRVVVANTLIPSAQTFPMLINSNVQYCAKGDSDYNAITVQIWTLLSPIITHSITGDISSDGITVANVVGNAKDLEVGRLVAGTGIPSNTFVASVDTTNNTFVLTQAATVATGIAITISRNVNSSNKNDFSIRDLYPNTSTGHDYNYVFTKSDGTTVESGSLADNIFDASLAFSKDGLIKDSFQINLYDVQSNIAIDGTAKVVIARASQDCSYIPSEFYDGARKQDIILAREVFNIWARIQELVYKIGAGIASGVTTGVTQIVNAISDKTADANNAAVCGSRSFYTAKFQAVTDSLRYLPSAYVSTITYNKYAIVRDPDSPEQYISRIDGNTGNGIANKTAWTKIDNLSVGEYHVTDSDSSGVYWQNHDMYIKNPAGQVLKQSDYPLLFAFYGNATDSSGTVSATGAYFKVPDMRNRGRVCVTDSDSWNTDYQTVGKPVGSAAFGFAQVTAASGTGCDNVGYINNQHGGAADTRPPNIVCNFFLKARLI